RSVWSREDVPDRQGRQGKIHPRPRQPTVHGPPYSEIISHHHLIRIVVRNGQAVLAGTYDGHGTVSRQVQPRSSTVIGAKNMLSEGEDPPRSAHQPNVRRGRSLDIHRRIGGGRGCVRRRRPVLEINRAEDRTGAG